MVVDQFQSNVPASPPVVRLQKTWGGAYDAAGAGVAIDRLGNIYVAGSTDSFNTPQKVGTHGYPLDSVLLIKYDPSGNLIWERVWNGGYWADGGLGIATDSSGYVYVTGVTDSFGPLTCTSGSPNCQSSHVFLLKFDSAGDLVWQRVWGDSSKGNVGGASGTGIAWILRGIFLLDLRGMNCI